MVTTKEKKRCWWCGEDPLYVKYHDEEWGTPVHDDQTLFEFLILEGMQAGLSWLTVLRKRENFREAFANFDAEKVSRFTEAKLQRLMQNPGIIRNRLKVYGAVKNAKAFLAVQKEFGSFDGYIWTFTGGKTITAPQRPRKGIIRAVSPESDTMSKNLKKWGFTFIGSTICYAFMQATGMVDDHVEECFRAGVGQKRK